ncbi:MAG: glycogen/starch synthase [Elusimicrobiota bacterium]
MSTWIEDNIAELKGRKILYLSMEMLFNRMNAESRSANFKGGLGILAGDTMEGLNNIGLDLNAVIPLYSHRWIETIEGDRQVIHTAEVDYSGENIEEVKDKEGNPVVLDIDFEGNTYPVQVLSALRSGAKVYLLRNDEVFDILYTGDRKKRLRQEVVVGKAVPALMEAVGLEIDFIHLNEAHTVTAACYIKEIEKYKNIPIIFTAHTPVPAGMEKYDENWFNLMDLPEKYLGLFNEEGVIDFTLAALKISSITNGVSKEHGEVMKNLFLTFRDKITGITNGSSLFWQAEEIKEDREMSPEKLWDIHFKHKENALRDASARLKEHMGLETEFDLHKPSAGLFRRLAGYKQQYTMLKDIIGAVCADRGSEVDTPFGKLRGLGMQIFVAGIAHPDDKERQEWAHRFIKWTKEDSLRGRFAFLPGYGQDLLMHGARGCDIWVSCPIKNLEACGTSDQRAALNGNINISTFTGGAREYLTEYSGENEGSAFFIDPYDPKTLYRKLEKAAELYYDCIEGKNDSFKKLMYNSYKAGMTMTVDNMAKAYAGDFYARALEMSK